MEKPLDTVPLARSSQSTQLGQAMSAGHSEMHNVTDPSSLGAPADSSQPEHAGNEVHLGASERADGHVQAEQGDSLGPDSKRHKPEQMPQNPYPQPYFPGQTSMQGNIPESAAGQAPMNSGLISVGLGLIPGQVPQGSAYPPVPMYPQHQFQHAYHPNLPPTYVPNQITPAFAPIVQKAPNGHPNGLYPPPQENEPTTKRQLERLEKQKQREAERRVREEQKLEQLRIKKEEREKKELEKKLKREALEAEKEQKREQERLKKEERRRKQEEEKAKKDQEKKRKEEEKLEREEEKRLKEEERKKKEEASQMKISNFFSIKKAVPVQSAPVESKPPGEVPKKQEISLYEIDFLPFFQKRNVSVSLPPQLLPEDLAQKASAYDKALSTGVASNLLNMFTKRANEAIPRYTTSEELVEAFNSSNSSPSQLRHLVENIPPVKYLQFYENAKPPYVGTWCSEKHLHTVITAEDPLNKTVTGFDYDYDSDLDWQDNDEGEGEDLGDGEDGEEEDEDADEDEMDDFVDNNDSVKKRGLIGPLQSVCVWNDGSQFEELQYERLDFDIVFPIDPFKNHWNASPSKNIPVGKERTITSVAQLGTPVKANSEPTTPNILTPQKPVIKDAKVLESLREFIKSNSDFTIGTLSELAKREFKAYTKSILRHTIQEVASYNKKSSTWEIKPVDALT